TLEGINVGATAIAHGRDENADTGQPMTNLARLNVSLHIAPDELSSAAGQAAHAHGIPAVVSVQPPPRYGRHLRSAVTTAIAAIFNPHPSAAEWRHPNAFVLHPPITNLPAAPKTPPRGTHYTLLSNLANKGVNVVLNPAAQLPDRKFLIVRSPVE